jgi:hypothetical protein
MGVVETCPKLESVTHQPVKTDVCDPDQSDGGRSENSSPMAASSSGPVSVCTAL